MSEAFATVRITVLGEDTCPRNWWLCCPKPEPAPVPERPTDFVPLDQYDLEFTYPLKSSRKPSRNPLQDGCVNCGPVFVAPDPPEPDPEPDPEPEIIAILETWCDSGEGFFDSHWWNLDDEQVSAPGWWHPGVEFTLETGNWKATYRNLGELSSQEGSPPQCCEPIYPYGILKQGDNVAYFSINWSCG